MSYSPNTTLKTFVTFRVVGDQLDPNEISAVLKLNPTIAYRNGQPYKPSERSSSTLIGKTGMWFYSTEREVKSTNFKDHIDTLMAHLALEDISEMLEDDSAAAMRILARHWLSWGLQPLPRFLTGRLQQLQSVLRAKNLTASVSCYWYGQDHATPPEFPKHLAKRLAEVPITIEYDFDTEATALINQAG